MLFVLHPGQEKFSYACADVPHVQACQEHIRVSANQQKPTQGPNSNHRFEECMRRPNATADWMATPRQHCFARLAMVPNKAPNAVELPIRCYSISHGK